jgi:hypothetical protein
MKLIIDNNFFMTEETTSSLQKLKIEPCLRSCEIWSIVTRRNVDSIL